MRKCSSRYLARRDKIVKVNEAMAMVSALSGIFMQIQVEYKLEMMREEGKTIFQGEKMRKRGRHVHTEKKTIGI